MRRLAFLLASVAMLGLAPVASAAPPADRVSIIFDDSFVVECDRGSLALHVTGWAKGPFNDSHPTHYHLTWAFSNADGESWTYIDTGNIRFFERDGVLYGFLAGRSTDVGPDGTGWIGHFVFNTDTGEATRVGRAVGYIDELACSMLT
jgi:hypothetical protein